MGGCGSTPVEDTGDAKKRSQAIDRNLEEDQRKLRRECKILLLGEYYNQVNGMTFRFTALSNRCANNQFY